MTGQAARTAVVVTSHPEHDALDVVMDSPDIDIAIFESPATAFQRIKHEQPSAVIISLSFDSATEFLLLTLLKLDRETASIPIWTCADLCDVSLVELIDVGESITRAKRGQGARRSEES
jgi:PleD family two-component response regulator